MLSFNQIVTPTFLQDFKWDFNIRSWFARSQINKDEAAHIRGEIQESVKKGTHAVELDVSDYKGVPITKGDLKKLNDETTSKLKVTRQDGVLKRIEDIFRLFF